MRPAARRLDRALVVLPSVTLGGTEQQTAVLARAMAEARLEVTLAMEPALRPDFAALPGAASELRSVTGPFGWQAGATAADNIAAQAAALAPLLQGLRPDLVILPLPWPGHGFGLLQALAAAGQRTLVIQHLAPQIADPVPEAAAPVLATLAAAPIRWAAVSAPVAARAAAFFGLPPAAVAVVPNGVPVPPADPAAREAARAGRRRRLGLPAAAPLVAFAGRLELQKGADLLPEIAARLHDACGATLAALGEGALRWSLEASPAARRGGPLRLLGHVPDVADWLLAADVLLLPSRYEGCPLVFLEAAARRCPVVASAAALECLGPAARDLAAIAASGGVADLTDQTILRLKDTAAVRPAVEAAYRHAVAEDEAAMLRRTFSLMRAALA